MKEPKIIEIAVLLLAVLYATLSWNIHHILDYIITNFTSYYIYIYIYLYDLYTPQIESTDPKTSQLSADVASWRSFTSTAEMLMLTAPGLTKMLALSEKALWSYRSKWFPMDQTSIKHPKTWDNAQVLAFFPPDHPVCQFWRPAWQSYTPWPWTAIHVQKPCSWRQVSEKPRMLAWW